MFHNMGKTDVDLFKEFLGTNISMKSFAAEKGIGYSVMRKLLTNTERLFNGRRVPVEDFFPEQVEAYKLKYSWANEPGYEHRPPNAIWNRKDWMLYIAAHEKLSSQSLSWDKDERKICDLTVAEFVRIIRSTLRHNGNAFLTR